MSSKVYIVLLNYNSSNHTIECLNSILKSSYKNICTIIVDNKSNDESVMNIEEFFKEKKLNYYITDKTIKCEKKLLEVDNILVKSDENRGFAAGNNIALNYIINNVEDGYVWVLNNDTYVDEYAIKNLIGSIEENTLLGSVLLDYNNKEIVQTVGGFKLNNYLGIPQKYYKGKNINEIDFNNCELDLDMISGASIFMCINTLKKIGLMPEEYFMYWEDTDWCYIAKSKGIKLDYCENSIVYHKEGGSIGNRSYNQVKLDFRNMLYFYYKNNRKYLKLLIFTKMFINIISSIKNKSGTMDVIKASLDGIKEFNLGIKNNV